MEGVANVRGAGGANRMSEWREVLSPDGSRVRWRETPGDYARADTGLELQRWHDGPGWRPVASWAAREWFWMGLRAGESAQVDGLPLFGVDPAGR